MKKIFIAVILIFGILSFNGFAQKQQNTRKISEMIVDSQRINDRLAGLLGGNAPTSGNTEITSLSAINFPNSVKVKYLNEIQKISKPRKKAVDKWLKDYAKQPDARKFYVNEIAVEEDGIKYWIMAHETSVIAKLASVKKDGEIILNAKILGFYRKGETTEYFLLADGLE